MERMPRGWRASGSAANNWLVYGQPNGEFALLKLPPIPKKRPPQLQAERGGKASRSESPSARHGNELPPLNKEPRAEQAAKDAGSVPGTAQRRARSERPPAEKEPPAPTDVSKRNPPLPPKALSMVRTKLTEAARVDALGLAQIESMLSRFDVDDSGAFSDEMLRRAIRKGLKVPGMTVSDGEISSICANLDAEKTGKVTMAKLLTFMGPVKFRRKERFGYQRSYVSPYRQSPSPDKLGSGRTSPTEARGTEAAGSATVADRGDAEPEKAGSGAVVPAKIRSSEKSFVDSPRKREVVASADDLENDLAASFSFGNAAPLEVNAKELMIAPPAENRQPVAEDDGESIASDVMPVEDDRRTQPDTARTVDTRLSAPVATDVAQAKDDRAAQPDTARTVDTRLSAPVAPEAAQSKPKVDPPSDEPHDEPVNDEESYDTDSFADESVASETEEVARRPSDVVSPAGSQVVKQPLDPEASSLDKNGATGTSSTQGGMVQSRSSPSGAAASQMPQLEPDEEEERLAKEEEIQEEQQMQDELDELLRIVG
mmetsp:Transcript_50156/g.92617  ORF Transcript_50156/g.92617 Transcript_50156/m.92617 type:complete len:543 (-) Transcript_50156:39-1667(-)